jgi:7,8-dihydropterin-6-yl-methyl-4-(beta-D-ribofuranosyl)aminobenzene 5'-phosphate synthase
MSRAASIVFTVIVLAIALTGAHGATITILYDNVPGERTLETGWGFSCYIEGYEKTILFDTGAQGDVLLSNMAKLHIPLSSIQVVVLSHFHGDHVGGIWSILKARRLVVYVPRSFPEAFKRRIIDAGHQVVQVVAPMRICRGIWTTGERGAGIKEQSLILHSSKGALLITGCAHPGIVNIARFTKEHLRRDVYMVLGGFHLMGYGDGEIRRIIRELRRLGVQRFAPSHCTGDRALELFRRCRGFIKSGCGARIAFQIGRPAGRPTH